MQEELAAIEANGTWEAVDLPVNRKAIGTKWVFKIKRRLDGLVERYRALLPADSNTTGSSTETLG